MRYLVYFTFSYSLTDLSGCIFPAEVGWMWSLVRYPSHPTCFLHLTTFTHTPRTTWKHFEVVFAFLSYMYTKPLSFPFSTRVTSRAWTPLPVAVSRLWGISAPHFRLHLWTFEETSPAWLYAAKGIKAFLSDGFKGEKLGRTLVRFEEEVRFNRLTFSNLPWKRWPYCFIYELY